MLLDVPLLDLPDKHFGNLMDFVNTGLPAMLHFALGI